MPWDEVVRTGPFVVSAVIFAAGAGWWANSQFRNTQIYLQNMLDKHEVRDQQRHEENIVRFTKIETKLDILNNGKH